MRPPVRLNALLFASLSASQKKKADDDARRIREIMSQQREQADAAATARSEEIATTREKLKRLGIDAGGTCFDSPSRGCFRTRLFLYTRRMRSSVDVSAH
jgi:hypothetical protein